MKVAIRLLILYVSVVSFACRGPQATTNEERPNIILLMADDLGWGDVGFNGNTIIKTPGLDRLAKAGVVLDRFYSASPVCSPTRGSWITGRTPYRYGIYWANTGFMKKEEVTIAEVLRELGYTTAHFGKWHLGTMSDSIPDARRGGKGNAFYSPPWDNGFDVCFSTEAAVPTWNPMKNQEYNAPSRYWEARNQYATDNLEGDDSRVMMDRVIPFIKNATSKKQPFLAVVWFHAPHSPVVAGEPYKQMYAEYDDNKQHYYGCITAMDEQIGRLQDELARMGIDKNTILMFSSDNGPAGEGGGVKQHPGQRQQGVTGGFRGRKGSLYEGGVRVPTVISWPAKLPRGQRVSFPMVSSDMFSTILATLNVDLPPRPYDGMNILPAILGQVEVRAKYIGFQTPSEASLVSHQYKLIMKKPKANAAQGNDGPAKSFELYDLINDKYETKNITESHPDVVQEMNQFLIEWMASCKRSGEGHDYDYD